MSGLYEQKCPACGAPMRFDPALGKMVCDYCETIVEIPEKKAKVNGAQGRVEKGNRKQENTGADGAEESLPVSGFDFAGLSEHAEAQGAEALPLYSCVSCGAEVIVPFEQMALTCPYCGNNIVLTDKVSGNLRPDAVVPFRVEEKTLAASVRHFYRDKKLLPMKYFSESTMGRVKGVYVPFWVFSGRMKGRLEYKAEKSESRRIGDYIITDTHHYRLTRDVSMEFRNVPVDASGRITDALMDSMEPFDLSEAKAFDVRYLAGFAADRFDQAREDTAERAEKRMRTTADSAASPTAGSGYVSVSRSGGRYKADMKALYMLLPVYMFDIAYGGKDYHYAVNGQTGKVVGSVPTDKMTSILYFALRAGIVAGVLMLFSVCKYFLGY